MYSQNEVVTRILSFSHLKQYFNWQVSLSGCPFPSHPEKIPPITVIRALLFFQGPDKRYCETSRLASLTPGGVRQCQHSGYFLMIAYPIAKYICESKSTSQLESISTRPLLEIWDHEFLKWHLSQKFASNNINSRLFHPRKWRYLIFSETHGTYVKVASVTR